MVAKQIYSIKEFAKEFELEEEYVRQCCRGKPIGLKGNIPHLPSGFIPVKQGRTWTIRRDSEPLPQGTEVAEQRASDDTVELHDKLVIQLAELLRLHQSKPELREHVSPLITTCRASLHQLNLELASKEAIATLASSRFGDRDLASLIAGSWWHSAGLSSALMNTGEVVRLRDASSLLEQIKLCYSSAVRNKRSVTASIELRKDGSAWILEPELKNGSETEALFLKLTVWSARYGADCEHLALLWHSVLSGGHPLGESSAQYLRKNSKCFSCGSTVEGGRKRKYCNDDCRKKFDDWIASVRRESLYTWESRIVRRMKREVLGQSVSRGDLV